MTEVDLFGKPGEPHWLSPKGKVDRETIRAKHRAAHYARPRERNPVKPETKARLERVTARAKKIEVARRVRVWNAAIAILDQTELLMRDIIERGFANTAGLDGLRLGEAMTTVNRVMKQITRLRTRAIKRAFRLLRDKGV